MGYKVFYSYQSDIQGNLNKKFIKEAIHEAIDEITGFDIDKPILEGFYGIGGNPPLAETMLDQSESADIFIGDVTFTSSKIWQSKGVGFIEDEKSYLIEINKPIDLKPAPNPNVLLETGYSWALKSNNRTILVMNEAFGNPKDLPVDFKGLRWPITYNLSEERFNKASKHKKEKQRLVKGLVEAISNSIQSSIEHQTMRWKPFLILKDLDAAHHSNYIENQWLTEKLKKWESAIDGEPIFISGVSKSGKTRFVLEGVKRFGSNYDVLFHDFNSVFNDQIGSPLKELRYDEDVPYILILKNCTEVKKYIQAFSDTHVQLIFIGEKFPEFESLFEFSRNSLMNFYSNLFQGRYNQQDIQKIVHILNYNVGSLLSVFNLSLDLSSDKSLFEQALIQNNLSHELVDLIGFISMNGRTGINHPYSKVLNIYIDYRQFGNKRDVLIESLKKAEYTVTIGDYIKTSAYSSDFKKLWWAKNKNRIGEFILNNSLTSVCWSNLVSFSSEEVKFDLFSDFDKEKGIFENPGFMQSINGKQLLDFLIQDFPRQLMSKIEDPEFLELLGENAIEVLQNLSKIPD